MKKIPIIAAVALAATYVSLGQTSYYGSALTATRGAESVSQCTMTFITESLPDFPIGVPANLTLEVCCGTPPYRFEVVQGTLPEGLHLNQNGKITGKPREEADTTVFVRLTDNAGCSLTQAFPVRVVPS
ncbi:MAG TPA: putative Ig domain-containing protein [Blastocatellia bacterium]|nr:putative Ig domain-containing protein [Blastocatellia bacterium]